MARTIHLEVVTPDGLKLSEDVLELTAPSVEGEFGVLPRHRPLLAGLKTGILRYKLEGKSADARGDGGVHAVAIGPGFAKVVDDKVSIITDRFMTKAEVDPVVARKELKEAESGISTAWTGASMEAKKALVASARWAAVRLELYGDPPPATVVVALETRLLASEKFAAEALAADAPKPDGDDSVARGSEN